MSRPDSAAPPVMDPPVRRTAPDRVPRAPLRVLLDAVGLAWRTLTRMRTALWLLFGLALQSAVATVVPQAPNVPGTVRAWLAGEEGPGAGVSRVLDALGAFDVYGSAIFLAFLLLLFLSLTACLVPRTRGWWRLVRRSQPPLLRAAAPDDLRAGVVVDGDRDAALAAAREVLGGRMLGVARWRVRSAPDQIAAETGLWSREGGSLAFHLSFYALLAAIVLGQLTSFEGQRGVVEGEPGFVDAAVSYWTYDPGRWFPEDAHAGWRLDLAAFEVDWIRDPLAPGAGQPTVFRSEVDVTRPDGSVERAVVEGNRPLVVDGRKIHQLDWGYAPRVVVRQGGEVVHDGWVSTLAGTGVFSGAVKAPAAEPDVGLELYLYPFAPDGLDGPRLTGAPWAEAPVLLAWQWRGDLQLGATQQTVTELDVSRLDLEGAAWLRPGDTTTFGDVEVEFVELRRWVGFQVSRRPQVPGLLAASALLTLGLVTALYAYRRRIWVLAEPGPEGPDGAPRTLLTVVGRAFQRPDAAAEEHARLVGDLVDRTGGTRT